MVSYGRYIIGHLLEVVAHGGINCLMAFNFVVHLKSAIEFRLSDYNFDDIYMSLQGSKLKKSSGCLLVTNWRNIAATCKFSVASFHHVNYTAHSMAQSIRFDCLKISQAGVSINLGINYVCLCDLTSFL